jgi:hypothetical protein
VAVSNHGSAEEMREPSFTPSARNEARQVLADFLSAAMSPQNTGEPWIALGEVAQHTSKLRGQRCTVAEVTAGLRGESVAAADIVDSIVMLRSARRGHDPASAESKKYRADAERLRRQAVSAGDAQRSSSNRLTGRARQYIRKPTFWAASVVTTALLTLLATSAIPRVIGQFVNGAAIEDHLRRGPDIIEHAELFDPGDEGIPLPTVVPGDFQPSAKLLRALSRPGSFGTQAIRSQVLALNGVNTRQIYIRVRLQGNRNEQIQILNVKLAYLHRGVPLNGVLFDVGPQGETNNIQMDFNLDQPLPHALVMREGMVPSTEPFFEAHSITLLKDEHAVLIIQANTLCYSASFMLAIKYTVGQGPIKTEIISDHGKSFRVTGYRWKNNFMSYRKILSLQGNFSVAPPTPAEFAQEYRRSPVDSCAS